MKKIIVLVFALGLVPALLHAAESCGCVAGDLACANNCAISKVNNVNSNIKANQQKAANSAKAQKDALKAKKDQAKKDAKAKKDQAKKRLRLKKIKPKKMLKHKKMPQKILLKI